MSDECARRLERKLTHALGEVTLAALADPSVIEVMLNPDGGIWIERAGCAMERAAEMEAVRAESLLGTLAAMHGTVVNAERPILEAELPFTAARFCGVLPPIVTAPAFCIRKPAMTRYTLADYERAGIIDSPSRASVAETAPRTGQAAALRHALRTRQNILIAGGVGGGKTTLTDTLLVEIVAHYAGAQRLLIIEDTRELACAAPNSIALRTSATVDMTRLVRTAMRLRPDRIIVGETRGPEALAMLKSWNTGHPGGVTTVHGNDAHDALLRLEQLMQEAGVPAQPAVIAAAIDVIVVIERTSGQRVIRELAYLESAAPEGYQLRFVAPDPRDSSEGA